MVTSKDETLSNEKKAVILQKLGQLETVHSGQTYFNGETFNMIDAAYAPMLMRLSFIKQHTGIDLLENTPKLAKWSESLLALDFVQASVVPELPIMYKGMIKHMDGFLATKLLD